MSMVALFVILDSLSIDHIWILKEIEEEVTFVDVECFGPRAEAVGGFFQGRLIFVEGRLKLDQWES